MTAIYKREMWSYFVSPIGYAYVAMFCALSNLVFCIFTLLAGADSSMDSYFIAELLVMALMTPLLTMKSFSEDKKYKTEQLLLTAPVTLPGFVFAKFLASYSVFGIGFLISSVNYPIMFSYLSDDLFQYNAVTALGGAVALLLVGATFIAIGVFISSLTENQVISAIGTMTTLVLLIGVFILNNYINFAPLREFFRWLSIYSRFTNFAAGYFDFASLIYYVSFTAVCLFLTVRVYEKRRWA